MACDSKFQIALEKARSNYIIKRNSRKMQSVYDRIEPLITLSEDEQGLLDLLRYRIDYQGEGFMLTQFASAIPSIMSKHHRQYACATCRGDRVICDYCTYCRYRGILCGRGKKARKVP
jgi:hypothetical protein